MPERPSRRAVALGLPLAGLFPQRTGAAANDDPPVLGTARSQYVVLDPPVPLQPVTLTDLGGHPARFLPARGKVEVVHLWATWCAACREDLLALQAFQARADARTAITTIAADKDDRQAVKAFVDRLGVGRLKVLHDRENRFARDAADPTARLPFYGLPVTYLVTPVGAVAGYVSGAVDWTSPDVQRLIAFYER